MRLAQVLFLSASFALSSPSTLAAARYSMEFEEIAVRAALCQPTRPIPNPCPKRRPHRR